jgi:uracil-xanthine permease
MADGYFPAWRVKAAGTVAPDERPPWGAAVALGAQHVVAMFGATVLAPLLMGFDPNVAILMSGVGTLIFFVITGGRVPSYLGSSFAFIGVVIAATGYGGHGLNAALPVALGGIVACGVAYAAIGLVVMATGTGWIERLMPPVVTGAVVAVIGLNLAPVAVRSAQGSTFDAAMALVTVLCIALIAVYSRGRVRRLPILLGLVLAYAIDVVATNVMGLGKPVDFGPVAAAAWLGMPAFTTPAWSGEAMTLIVPVAIVLVAENLGHIKAVSAMTGRNLDPLLGRAFLGDGVATIVSGMAGGTGVTTYAENIGVMAVTRIFSTVVFVIAALVALVLGFSPKFGALIGTTPAPVLAGVSLVVFGLIAIAGARIWVQNRVDFANNRNLVVAAAILTLGAGDFALRFGTFTLGGIGTATFGGILLYAILAPARAPD